MNQHHRVALKGSYLGHPACPRRRPSDAAFLLITQPESMSRAKHRVTCNRGRVKGRLVEALSVVLTACVCGGATRLTTAPQPTAQASSTTTVAAASSTDASRVDSPSATSTATTGATSTTTEGCGGVKRCLSHKHCAECLEAINSTTGFIHTLADFLDDVAWHSPPRPARAEHRRLVHGRAWWSWAHASSPSTLALWTPTADSASLLCIPLQRTTAGTALKKLRSAPLRVLQAPRC